MLETHFGPLSALVWSSFMTFGCCAARRAAPYGDASGADFRPSDVDYEGPPSLIQMIEGSNRSGSLRSLQWCIVIGRNQKVITRNRSVTAFSPFFRLAVSRGVPARTPRSHPEVAGSHHYSHFCKSPRITSLPLATCTRRLSKVLGSIPALW